MPIINGAKENTETTSSSAATGNTPIVEQVTANTSLLSTQRKRKPVERLEPNFEAAGKSVYKNKKIRIARQRSEESDGSDLEDIDDLAAAAGQSATLPNVMGNLLHAATGIAPISSSNPDIHSSKAKMDQRQLATLIGTIQANLLDRFKVEIKGFDLNDLTGLTLKIGRDANGTLLQFIISQYRFDFVEYAISAGARADITCLDMVLKTSVDGDAIEAIRNSLKIQGIKIPQQIIDDIANRKRPKGYTKDYIPELIEEFKNHNSSIGDHAALSEAPVALAPLHIPTDNPNQPSTSSPLLQHFAQIAVNASLHVILPVTAPKLTTTVPVSSVISAMKQDDGVEVSSLAFLRKRLETLNQATAQIKNDFSAYEACADKFQQASLTVEKGLTDYMRLLLEHDRLKKSFWNTVQEFKVACEEHIDNPGFLAKECPELDAEYKRVTEARVPGEINLTKTLAGLLDYINKKITPLNVSAANISEYAAKVDAKSSGGASVSKRLRVEESELFNIKRIQEFIDQISAQHRQAITESLATFTANCKLLLANADTLNIELNNYCGLMTEHNAVNEQFWRAISKILKPQPTLDPVVAFKQQCPELAVQYDLITKERHTSRASLQRHLHNVVVYREQRAKVGGSSPGIFAKGTSSSAPGMFFSAGLFPTAPAYSPSFPLLPSVTQPKLGFKNT
jgi:hypothetical protein